MIESPVNIRAHQADQVLELSWPGGRIDRLTYRHLRSHCPCASCRDEWTGQRLFDPAMIRDDLQLEGMESVGNYAVRLNWSDGHSTGIYTWEALHKLADEPAAD